MFLAMCISISHHFDRCFYILYLCVCLHNVTVTTPPFHPNDTLLPPRVNPAKVKPPHLAQVTTQGSPPSQQLLLSRGLYTALPEVLPSYVIDLVSIFDGFPCSYLKDLSYSLLS